MGDIEVLYRNQPRQPANKNAEAMESTPTHFKNKLRAHTRHPLPLASCLLRRWAHDHLSHPIPARACTPFPPAQSLALQTWAGSEAAQGWGLGLRGSGVIWGYETLLQSPLPSRRVCWVWEGGFQLLRSSSPGPTSCITCPATQESSLSGQGRREEKDSKSVSERTGRNQNVPARPELISPLTQSPGLPAPGACSRSHLGQGWRPLVAEKEHYERFSDRIGTLL